VVSPLRLEERPAQELGLDSLFPLVPTKLSSWPISLFSRISTHIESVVFVGICTRPRGGQSLGSEATNQQCCWNSNCLSEPSRVSSGT